MCLKQAEWNTVQARQPDLRPPRQAASEVAGTQGCRSKRGVGGDWVNIKCVLPPPAHKVVAAVAQPVGSTADWWAGEAEEPAFLRESELQMENKLVEGIDL